MNKPKPKSKAIKRYSAREINLYLRDQFDDKDCFDKCSNKFWKWFFGETEWGETNLLSLYDEDVPPFIEIIPYFHHIRNNFWNKSLLIEIENDL